jgi:hypothetical protein
MKVFTIWGQRTCNYPGEYAPELLAAADEYTEDDNPDYLAGEEDKAKGMVESGEMSYIRRISFEIPDADFEAAFIPDVPCIKATIS